MQTPRPDDVGVAVRRERPGAAGEPDGSFDTWLRDRRARRAWLRGERPAPLPHASTIRLSHRYLSKSGDLQLVAGLHDDVARRIGDRLASLGYLTATVSLDGPAVAPVAGVTIVFEVDAVDGDRLQITCTLERGIFRDRARVRIARA